MQLIAQQQTRSFVPGIVLANSNELRSTVEHEEDDRSRTRNRKATRRAERGLKFLFRSEEL